MVVLTATQTTGDTFKVKGGRYQIVVEDYAGDVTLEIQAPASDPVAFMSTAQVWTADGVRAFWMSAAAVYRVSAASAGATATLQPIAVFEIPGRV